MAQQLGNFAQMLIAMLQERKKKRRYDPLPTIFNARTARRGKLKSSIERKKKMPR
jgi:hypothetical protein